MPELYDFTNWGELYLDQFKKSIRKIVNRNKQIMVMILQGASCKSVAKKFGLAPSFIHYLLNRCLGGNQDDPPNLLRGLIPGKKLKGGKRVKKLSTLNNPCGARGSLTYIFLKHPTIKKSLDHAIEAGVKRKPTAQNLTPLKIHEDFLELLKKKKWPSDKYPYDRDNLGYESLRKYFHRKKEELLMPKPKEQSGSVFLNQPKIAYQEVQIDSQVTDVFSSIYIDFNGQSVPLRLPRLALFLAVDSATNCILGYHLCFSKDPNQFDLLTLFANIFKKWKPKKLTTKGLKYEPTGCLPGALGKEYRNALIGRIMLDNALCHMSHMVEHHVCNKLNATLNFGRPAHPLARRIVEALFNMVNRTAHLFASATGSSVISPIKETTKNAKKAPKLTLDTLKEVLDIIITAHNAKEQVRLGGQSPIELIKNHMNRYPIPLNFRNKVEKIDPLTQVKIVPVKWIKKDKRAPHINFCGFRFKGSSLYDVDLINQKIMIKFNVNDIRSLEAFNLDGTYLGTLKAPSSWQQDPISMTLLKSINKHTKKQRMLKSGYTTGYFENLLNNKHKPKVAAQIAYLININGIGHLEREFNKRQHVPSNDDSDSLRSGIKAWTPSLFKGGQNV